MKTLSTGNVAIIPYGQHLHRVRLTTARDPISRKRIATTACGHSIIVGSVLLADDAVIDCPKCFRSFARAMDKKGRRL